MKKSVRNFINVTLTGTAWELGFIQQPNEILVPYDVFNHYANLKDIPNSGMVMVKDRKCGSILGQLYFTGSYKSTNGKKWYEIQSITRGDVTKRVRQVDWMDYLHPIVEDFRDGSDDLTVSDIDWLMVILRAKIEYSQRLISKEEYDMIINDTEN